MGTVVCAIPELSLRFQFRLSTAIEDESLAVVERRNFLLPYGERTKLLEDLEVPSRVWPLVPPVDIRVAPSRGGGGAVEFHPCLQLPSFFLAIPCRLALILLHCLVHSLANIDFVYDGFQQAANLSLDGSASVLRAAAHSSSPTTATASWAAPSSSTRLCKLSGSTPLFPSTQPSSWTS